MILSIGCSKVQENKQQEKLTTTYNIGELRVTSPAFLEMDKIASKYTCDGENINPPLKIENIPSATKTLAIVLDDPDAKDGPFVHWIMINIKPTQEILENSVMGTQLTNDAGKRNYWGPCPPQGEHRYRFIVYALDTELPLTQADNKYDFEKAIAGHVFAKGMITVRYTRKEI